MFLFTAVCFTQSVIKNLKNISEAPLRKKLISVGK